MKFNYASNEYELMEMIEPYENKTFGILAIFRIKYVVITKDLKKVEVFKHDDYDFEDYEYINYFCNQDDKKENIILAMQYIDEYLKKDGKTL